MSIRPFIELKPSKEAQKKEAERIAFERSAHIVRVEMTGAGKEALIYRRGRAGLKYQDLDDAQITKLGDSNIAFFEAVWRNDHWDLIRRVKGWG